MKMFWHGNFVLFLLSTFDAIIMRLLLHTFFVGRDDDGAIHELTFTSKSFLMNNFVHPRFFYVLSILSLHTLYVCLF